MSLRSCKNSNSSSSSHQSRLTDTKFAITIWIWACSRAKSNTKRKNPALLSLANLRANSRGRCRPLPLKSSRTKSRATLQWKTQTWHKYHLTLSSSSWSDSRPCPLTPTTITRFSWVRRCYPNTATLFILINTTSWWIQTGPQTSSKAIGMLELTRFTSVPNKSTNLTSTLLATVLTMLPELVDVVIRRATLRDQRARRILWRNVGSRLLASLRLEKNSWKQTTSSSWQESNYMPTWAI